jgi:L-sorbose 1-phosphate reductase
MTEIPSTQHAIQYVGKDEIVHNTNKPVDQVGPTQLLLKVEACGICFSDTKLLHQFDVHPRKVEVIAGLTPAELAEIPSYKPGAEPTVPGHEPVCRVVAVGDEVTHFKIGDRVLVQADWKHMRTPTSNGSFGYAFEGALQEYVLVDERIVVRDGEEYLIQVSEGPTSAQVGLIEPWATVENAYAWQERQGRKEGGNLLVVAGAGASVASLADGPTPGHALVLGSDAAALGIEGTAIDSLDGLAEHSQDDIVYFGSDAATIEALGELLGNRGLLAVVLDGEKIDRAVSIDMGRIHYDFIRFVGTAGRDPADAYAMIPVGTEVRDGDKMMVIGAAGPMGLMHTMRAVVLGKSHLTIDCTDVSDDRLEHLREVIAPVAADKGVGVRFINSAQTALARGYTYVTCMVPSTQLLAMGIDLSGQGAIVNLFAGLPAGTHGAVDLQGMIERKVFLAGTSGSDIIDMRTVLSKIENGDYDTSISLDAVTGMAGFKDAIQSVMDRTSGGKIMVYPSLHDLPLIRVVDMGEKLPEVAALLRNGVWTPEAEKALLAHA